MPISIIDGIGSSGINSGDGIGGSGISSASSGGGLPLLVVSDTFTETVDTAIASHTPDTDYVGGGWSTVGAWTTAAVNATSDYFDMLGGSSTAALIDAGSATCTIRSTYFAGSKNRDHKILLRYTDINNYFCVESISDSGRIYIVEVTAGVQNVRASNLAVTTLWDTIYVQDDGTRISVGTDGGAEDVGYSSTDKFGTTVVGYLATGLVASNAARADTFEVISVADYTQLP